MKQLWRKYDIAYDSGCETLYLGATPTNINPIKEIRTTYELTSVSKHFPGGI